MDEMVDVQHNLKDALAVSKVSNQRKMRLLREAIENNAFQIVGLASEYFLLKD